MDQTHKVKKRSLKYAREHAAYHLMLERLQNQARLRAQAMLRYNARVTVLMHEARDKKSKIRKKLVKQMEKEVVNLKGNPELDFYINRMVSRARKNARMVIKRRNFEARRMLGEDVDVEEDRVELVFALQDTEDESSEEESEIEIEMEVNPYRDANGYESDNEDDGDNNNSVAAESIAV